MKCLLNDTKSLSRFGWSPWNRGCVALAIHLCFFVLSAHSAPPDWLAIQNVRIHTQSKQGVLEKGTVLIREGKIVEVGEKVTIPVSATLLDGRGKVLTPSFISVFHPVNLQRASEGETRTVTVRGRTLPVAGRPPSSNTNFVKVAELFPLDAIDWRGPLRCGVTTMHIATPGYCQTAVIQPGVDQFTSVLLDAKHNQLLITLTNNSQSLDLLRNSLKANAPNSANAGSSGTPPAAGSRRGSGRSSPGREVGPPAGEPVAPASPSADAARAAVKEATPEQKLWNDVRDGKSILWVNVNNSATILHALGILKDYPKVKVAWIANGGDFYQTLDEYPKDSSRLILSPRIDLVPNSRLRINMPALVSKSKLPFALSIGTRAADFEETQAAPTFALAMLAKTGLGEEEALRSVTLGPAEFLGIEGQLGSIEPGKNANLILFDGSPFETATSISEVFLEGRPVNEK